MLFFKLFGFVWPYLKELVLGDRSIRQAMRHNKLRMLFVAAIFCSFGLNFLAIPKVFSLSARIVALQKNTCLPTKLVIKEAPKPEPVAVAAEYATTPPKSSNAQKRNKVKQSDEVNEAIRELNRIKQKEEMELNK